MFRTAKIQLLGLLVVCLTSISFLGCSRSDVAEPEKAPRPVSVIALKSGSPTTTREVSASVSSWKTEQIGFEVGGRVAWVLEPGEEIEGRVFDTQGNVVTSGTALAQLDTERYGLALEAAKAQVEVAELEKAGVEVKLNSGIPASIEAAQADLELALVEYDRNKRLVAQNATAQADLDRSAAELRTARAKIATLDAETKQTQAQLKSAVASIKQAEQGLKEAQRDFADTTLYSSFRGQVADVHVVSGSVVAQGSPVLTIQMMDPIKIEVELSAELSRTIRKRHHLPVFITLADGSTIKQEGFIYTVSPTADPSTRTFTLTLLVLNRKIKEPIPEEHKEKNLARAADIWRMNLDFLPGMSEGTHVIDKEAIYQDEQGYYVWKCLNVKTHQPIPELLKVAKMRVTPSDRSVPFLGNWVFQTITIHDADFNPETDMVAGELTVDSGTPSDWDGDQMILDRGGQWMLRPGDLVSVDLSESETPAGFYVPMEAIYEDSGDASIFSATEEVEGTTVAKRIPVEVVKTEGLGVGTIRLIKPLGATEFTEGMPVIVGGVHFLHDGDKVHVTERN